MPRHLGSWSIAEGRFSSGKEAGGARARCPGRGAGERRGEASCGSPCAAAYMHTHTRIWAAASSRQKSWCGQLSFPRFSLPWACESPRFEWYLFLAYV